MKVKFVCGLNVGVWRGIGKAEVIYFRSYHSGGEPRYRHNYKWSCSRSKKPLTWKKRCWYTYDQITDVPNSGSGLYVVNRNA